MRERLRLEALLDLVYPRNCCGCGDVVEGRLMRYLCRSCVIRLPLVWEPGCPVCGHPAADENGRGVSCGRCLLERPRYTEGRTVLMMRGSTRSLVHTLKYRSGRFLLADLGQLIQRIPGLTDFVAGAVLVPVPLHAARLRHRGYNQSRLLAELFAGIGRNACCEDLLVRIKRTSSQTALAPAQRRSNVKNAFALRSGRKLDSTVRYIIVDDVLTTGATLNSCADALHGLGARRLAVLTLAQG